MLLYFVRAATPWSSFGQPVGNCLGLGGQDQWTEPGHGEKLISERMRERGHTCTPHGKMHPNAHGSTVYLLPASCLVYLLQYRIVKVVTLYSICYSVTNVPIKRRHCYGIHSSGCSLHFAAASAQILESGRHVRVSRAWGAVVNSSRCLASHRLKPLKTYVR